MRHTVAEQGREPALGCCSPLPSGVGAEHCSMLGALELLRESMCVAPAKLQFTQASK